MRQRDKGLNFAHLKDLGFRYETGKKEEYENLVFPLELELTPSYRPTLYELRGFCGWRGHLLFDREG